MSAGLKLVPDDDSKQMKMLREKLAELRELRASVKRMKQNLATAKETEGQVEDEVRAMLDVCGLDKVSAEGLEVSMSPMLSISMPQTPEAKIRFFDWMKERGIFEDYATINSNSLRSFITAEIGLKYPDATDNYEIAEAFEADPDKPQIPGMEHVRTFNKLNIKESKR